MTPEQIQSLLRERGGNRMPEGYTERLLRQLHQKQRSEFLRQPVWRIAWERAVTLLSEHSLSTPRYAFALAALLAVSIGVIALLKPAGGGPVVARQDRSLKSDDLLRQRVEAQQVSFEK
jgi:hypothetical protein